MLKVVARAVYLVVPSVATKVCHLVVLKAVSLVDLQTIGNAGRKNKSVKGRVYEEFV